MPPTSDNKKIPPQKSISQATKDNEPKNLFK